MWSIPKQDRQTFQRHFLERVIVELRFKPIPARDWKGLSGEVKKSLSKLGHYNVNPTFDVEFNIPSLQVASKPKSRPKAAKAQLATVKSTPLGLTANEIEGGISLEIRRDRYIFIAQKYNGFEDFWASIDHILSSLQELIEVSSFSWIGIRKINQLGFQSDTGDYKGEGFNELLFAPLRQGVFSPSAFRLGETRYSISEDGLTCNIRVSSTRASEGKLVNLRADFDFNQTLKEEKNVKEIKDIAEKLNEHHFDLFKWVTDPTLIEAMTKEQ